MAHIRQRLIQPLFKKVIGFSPIVGLLGHRQVGKTTFLESNISNYVTFDSFKTITKAREDSEGFIESFKGKQVAIDECQYVASLFPALKEFVRKNKKPGQFILSGSVRFTSKKSIRESLTGRILNLELLPMSVSELRNRELPTTALSLLTTRSAEKYCLGNQKYISDCLKLKPYVEQYATHGGLPGVCFVRDPALRNSKIKDQLTSIIDRDLRLIYETKVPYIQIFEFLRYLASNEGHPLNYSKIERVCKISEEVQKNLIFALESVFVLRQIPVEGRSTHPLLYFEDQAEMNFLSDSNLSQLQINEGILFRNIRLQFSYTAGQEVRYFHYLTRGGARVPLAIQSKEGTVGMLCIESDLPNKSEKQIAASFLKNYADSMVVFISSRSRHFEPVDNRSLIAPIELFL